MKASKGQAGIIIPHNKIEFTGEILGEGGFGMVKKGSSKIVDSTVI